MAIRVKNKINERNIIEFIRRHIILIAFFGVSVTAFLLRWQMIEFQTADFYAYVNAWIQELSRYPGLSGLGENIGEYNVPYMFFLAILPYTPFNYLYAVKIFSIIFDYLGAIAAVKIVAHIGSKKLFTKTGLAVYSAILLSPCVFLDSAYWGQCDSIYFAMLLFCLYYMLKEKYAVSMIFFGISLSFKLQAVFFLPVILIYYFASRKMSIKYILCIPAAYLVMILPAIFAGRGFKDTLLIYFSQTELYAYMTLSCPNLYNIFPDVDYYMFKNVAIFLTLSVLGVGAALFISNKKEMTKKDLLLLSLWVFQVCIFFLPAMHERYAFGLCILSLIWAFAYHKDWIVAVGLNYITLRSFVPYLTQTEIPDMRVLSIGSLLLLILTTYRLLVKPDYNKMS